ncbi:hypothetical protein [Streptosporangium saharense]|uniref:Uncharacterized protein n=1 Tax=Streptosporangium saharense TaxID=1706840 RepID=A0A7W7QMC3_9ACTN|nr:hypothetical protein [Streptosporangium saharense]MBB4916221.1 hypothetical protein [Streptosporangium saharense]
MAIYSQHANRGKVQILATYRAPDAVRSVTVTSVENAALATPLVNALNRVSAYATVPVAVWDERGRGVKGYPADHLAALVDEKAREDLLKGAHSLWYAYVKLLLNQALIELDAATSSLPAPVRAAVKAELETEAGALAVSSEDSDVEETEDTRLCEIKNPFVTFDSHRGNIYLGDPHCLEGEHSRFDRLENGAFPERLERAVDDLRLLYDVYVRCDNDEVNFVIDRSLSIEYEPLDESGRYFLSILAPMPVDDDDAWNLEIVQWIPDDPEDDDGSATGEPVLRCVRATPPTASELIEVLNLGGKRARQLADWAATPVGEALEGTTFVVTHRYDN